MPTHVGLSSKEKQAEKLMERLLLCLQGHILPILSIF